MRDPHRRNLRRARHHVVAERGGERLADLVVGDFLVERGADALRDAALHLAVDDHRIDHGAAVFRDRVVENFDDAGVGLDGDDHGMGAIGEHAAGFRGLVGAGGVEQRLHAGRQMLLADVGGIGDLGEADAAGRAVHRAGLDAGVGDVGLQQVRADFPDLLDQHPAGARHRAAAEHDGARAEAAETERRRRGVAIADGNQRRADAELVGGDLRERGLVALAEILRADMDDDRAIGQHAGVGGFVARHHARLALDPFDRAVAALLGVERKADADGAAVGLALAPGGRGWPEG